MLAAILFGVIGTPLVFLASLAVARRLPERPVPARLLTAREQLLDNVGPIGAFVMLYGAGIYAITAVGLLLGEFLQRIEDPVDWPTFRYVEDVQDTGWASVMNTVGQMGNIDETRVVAVVSIVVLTAVALLRRERPWVPAALISCTVLTQKFGQAALAKIVDRGHPPTTLGTYPSGGCARILAIYGTIMFLVLAYARAGRLLRSAGWALIVTLAFAEGYTRMYLNKHWLTDVWGGWAVGGMMLVVTVFAARALLDRPDGRARTPDGNAAGRTPEVV
ncbi:phosphatase PAP2 family protein [Actinomadura flavalba]|uniref:phosphatase PAP2 family protein n=1 Tax=Actinomadura flavalba TaxID=1120938 RepID=UPI00036A18D0|nr:phosphatase PAP2 family protein [Actinomadura flavalba]